MMQLADKYYRIDLVSSILQISIPLRGASLLGRAVMSDGWGKLSDISKVCRNSSPPWS